MTVQLSRMSQLFDPICSLDSKDCALIVDGDPQFNAGNWDHMRFPYSMPFQSDMASGLISPSTCLVSQYKVMGTMLFFNLSIRSTPRPNQYFSD